MRRAEGFGWWRVTFSESKTEQVRVSNLDQERWLLAVALYPHGSLIIFKGTVSWRKAVSHGTTGLVLSLCSLYINVRHLVYSRPQYPSYCYPNVNANPMQTCVHR
ncbi:hypothetical protein VTK73DRAFT_8191 [Phialemonium thermophilum]|uniref:Uncharacterized protein n=1 Tax=Phialemonium thermophilum TaxID=223376 RepID=A0ABR3XQ02_9PEZI